jgi:hypothetical protein
MVCPTDCADIQSDTRKLDTTENFTARLTKDREQTSGGGGMDDSPQLSLKSFVEQRRAYLLGLD